MRRVPGAVAAQRRGKKDVRHAAMAVVRDAHVGIEPGRLAVDCVAVISPLIEYVEFDIAADLLDGALHDLGVLRNFEIGLGRQRDIEATTEGAVIDLEGPVIHDEVGAVGQRRTGCHCLSALDPSSGRSPRRCGPGKGRSPGGPADP